MSLTVQFLSEIRKFLKNRNGNELRGWLLVEPPLPDQYHKLADELKKGYRNSASLTKMVEKCLPEDDNVSDDEGTAWPGFVSFMKDYLEYWRDVDFEDLLGAHQLLTALTNSCTTALNNPTYGTIMLQTSISLCASLSKLSMTLNKRPDLTRNLQTRHEQPKGKKTGVYIFANVTLKLLFAARKTHLAKQLFTNITAKAPPLAFYPAAQRVTFLYYLGRFHFINNHFSRAAQCLQEAYLETPQRFQNHRLLVLTYLVPCNLLLGRIPSPQLLQRPEAQSLAPIFMPFVEAMRTGNHLRFQAALDANEKWLYRRGIFLTLLFRLRPLVWRAFSRRTFLLTYIAPTEADSRKAATLELSHLLTTATFVQKRLEGYLPAHPGRKPRQPHINSMFLKAVSNSAAGSDEHSTLAPPPGGQRNCVLTRDSYGATCPSPRTISRTL
ncbi:hypothetical protein PG990_009727 [Apiospora arundinis]